MQAYEMFPWADIEKSLTLDGLINSRWGPQRHTWGRVIAGTNEQLAPFIERYIRLSPINFNCPQEAAAAFASYLVPQIERVLTNGITREETWAWYAAWRAAEQYKGA